MSFFLEWGTHKTMAPSSVRRRIKLSNQIAAITSVIMLVAAFKNQDPRDKAMLTAVIGLAGAMISIPVWNIMGFTTISRLVLVLLPPPLLILPLSMMNDAGNLRLGHYAVVPDILLVMSLNSLLLFERESESSLRKIGILFYSIVLLTHDMLLQPKLTVETLRLVQEEFTDVKLSVAMLWILILMSVEFLSVKEKND